MMRLSDYLFFRVFSFYRKKRDSSPAFTAYLVAGLSISLGILTLDIISSLLLKRAGHINKGIMLILLLSSVFLMSKRYKNEALLLSLDKKYSNEPRSLKRRNGCLLVLYFIIVLGIPILIGYLRHNLGWNI